MNPFRKIRIFYGETVSEVFKKSQWPTWAELKEYTIVVIIAVAIVGFYVSIADFALFNVVDLFTSLVLPSKGF